MGACNLAIIVQNARNAENTARETLHCPRAHRRMLVREGHPLSKGCCVGASSRSDSSYSDSEDGSEDVRVCSEGWNPSKRGDGAASDPQR